MFASALSTNASRRQSPGGFTLVELLVVISVISVLISVLLPAINRAREQGKLAVCLSNMHSIALASTNYLLDYRDNYPPIYIPAPVNNRSQMYWLGKKGLAGSYLTANATTRYLNPYLGQFTADSEVRVARCPNDEQPTYAGSSAFYNTHGTSYVANATGPNFPTIQSISLYGPAPICYYSIRSSRIADAARMVLMAEFGVFDPIWSNVDPGINFRWHDRSAVSSTVAFAGGHAKLIYPTRTGSTYNVYTENYTFDIRY